MQKIKYNGLHGIIIHSSHMLDLKTIEFSHPMSKVQMGTYVCPFSHVTALCSHLKELGHFLTFICIFALLYFVLTLMLGSQPTF
jgi:hypothetical protein